MNETKQNEDWAKNVYPNEKMREVLDDLGNIKKPRGLQQILSDAGTFTSDDIRMAARLAILESVKKTGQVITMRDVEGICDSVAKLITKNKAR